jgi:hypothetical protein
MMEFVVIHVHDFQNFIVGYENNFHVPTAGLPQRYRDSVRAIQPGLPLFLYNYTTHQLHGIFEASELLIPYLMFYGAA